MAKKKWMGDPPSKCDVCGGPVGATFVDGKTVLGPWGFMCAACHGTHGYGLGTGRGQRYDSATLEKLEG